MGINKKASDDLDRIFSAFIATSTPNRAKQRKYMAMIRDRSGEWLAAFDAQEVTALDAFKAQQQAALDALPSPTISTTDPTT